MTPLPSSFWTSPGRDVRAFRPSPCSIARRHTAQKCRRQGVQTRPSDDTPVAWWCWISCLSPCLHWHVSDQTEHLTSQQLMQLPRGSVSCSDTNVVGKTFHDKSIHRQMRVSRGPNWPVRVIGLADACAVTFRCEQSFIQLSWLSVTVRAAMVKSHYDSNSVCSKVIYSNCRRMPCKSVIRVWAYVCRVASGAARVVLWFRFYSSCEAGGIESVVVFLRYSSRFANQMLLLDFH